MKVNIKGLVFVGFAAAILSGAAKADDKQIVTSKSYTDATYQTKIGGGANADKVVVASSTAGAPTYLGFDNTPTANSTNLVKSGAIQAAIAASQTATTYTGSDGITLTDHNFTNSGIRDVTATAENGNNGTITINKNGTTSEVAVKGLASAAYVDTTNDTTFAIAADTGKLPTAATVKAYADTKVAANAAITGATKTKITYDAKGLVTGGADLAASDLPAITDDATSDAGKILVVGNDGKITVGSTSASGTYQIVADKVASIDDDSTSQTYNVNTDKYASTAAVTGWAQKKIPAGTAGKLVTYSGTAGTVSEATLGTAALTIKQNNVANSTTFGANANEAVTINLATPDWNAASDAAGYIANKPSVEVTGNKVTTITSAATDTQYPSAAAVYSYVTGLPSNGYPSLPTGPDACTDAAPCALVATTSGAAWVKMAQPTAQ